MKIKFIIKFILANNNENNKKAFFINDNYIYVIIK